MRLNVQAYGRASESGEGVRGWRQKKRLCDWLTEIDPLLLLLPWIPYSVANRMQDAIARLHQELVGTESVPSFSSAAYRQKAAKVEAFVNSNNLSYLSVSSLQ